MMKGKERIITALSVKQPDRVPLYIHGINEAPIISIGKHITDGLPESKRFHEMNDADGERRVLHGLHKSFPKRLACVIIFPAA